MILSHPTLIENYAKKSLAAALMMALLRGALKFVGSFFILVLIQLEINQFVDITEVVNKLWWAGSLLISGAMLISSFFPISQFSIEERSINLSQKIKAHLDGDHLKISRGDELKLALELIRLTQRQGISEQLKDSYIHQFATFIKNCPVAWTLSNYQLKKWLLAVLMITATGVLLGAVFPNQFPLSPHSFNPFLTPPLREIIAVSPGNTDIGWGEDLEVKVSLKIKSLHKPALHVKSNNEWKAYKSADDSQGAQIFGFRHIIEPLNYRVYWKGSWGEVFTINPVKPITIDQFKIKIQEPDYVGKTVREQSQPELTGLPGSIIYFEGKLSKPVDAATIYFSDGSRRAMTVSQGGIISCQFELQKELLYGFEFNVEEKKQSIPPIYPIRILIDKLPELKILSPENDLIIGENETLPLTFESKDDFGLVKASLIWINSKDKETRIKINSYSQNTPHVLETYEWSLSNYNFQPGEVIRYQLVVEDGNIITGPGIASSDWQFIEIAAFELGHAELERKLKKWRDEILDLLADVNTTKSKVDKKEASLESLIPEFYESVKKSYELNHALDKLVSMMEEDPLADYGIWLEHKAMSENMKAMNNGSVLRAQSALQTNHQESASLELDNMASELERMLALSEELSKTQKARDVIEAGEKLSELGNELKNNLEEMANKKNDVDQKQLQKLNEMIKKAVDLLSKMAKSLEDFPNELPEDFVNQEALKNLDMKESSSLLDEISKAIKSGDMQRAMDLARQFLASAMKMSEQLNEAHESYLKENSAEELENEIDSKMAELDLITNEQRNLLAETQKLEKKRLESINQEQENILELLKAKQKDLIDKARAQILRKDFPDRVRNRLAVQMVVMEEVLTEFSNKKIENSKNWVPGIIAELGNINVEVKKSSGSAVVLNELGILLDGEIEINGLIQTPPKEKADLFKNDQDTISELKKRQEKLTKKTSDLKSGIQELSRKTASVGVPLTQSLGKAGQEMETASGNLADTKIGKAKMSQEGALQYLGSAKQNLQQAQGAMGKMSENQAGTGQAQGPGRRGPNAVRRGGGRNGSSGTEAGGKVRLPTADEYRPPKEFREELLESLKEKYPDNYKDIIHKYFKRLSN